MRHFNIQLTGVPRLENIRKGGRNIQIITVDDFSKLKKVIIFQIER